MKADPNAQPLDADDLDRIASLMNRVGVLEAVRLLALDGLDNEHPLRCGRDYRIIPYTEHLSRERAIPGPLSILARKMPTIQVPDLVLLDVLPGFYRTFCQPYRFSEQVNSRRERGFRRGSNVEQKGRQFFGDFVNLFLNAILYQMGADVWARSSRCLASIPAKALQENPVAAPICQLQEALADSPLHSHHAVARIAALVPMLSHKGMDQGRFRWGIRALFKAIWPHQRWSLSFPGMAPDYGRLHPTAVTYLGEQCGLLGEDFYLGEEVMHESRVLLVDCETKSHQVFQDLRPGPLHDAILMVANHWLKTRQLSMQLRLVYTGDWTDLPWRLGASQTSHDEAEQGFGRLGYNTFLT